MIGGFLGALCRYLVGMWLYNGNGFPIGTLVVNLIGCLFLGWFLSSAMHPKRINANLVLLIGTGFTGSFTTFSTFSVEVVQLVQVGRNGLALLYITSSIGFGLMLAYVGYSLARLKKVEMGQLS
nr:fluoride efflux transporter CrcB [Fredinandcohnia sp. SECRCQ15]